MQGPAAEASRGSDDPIAELPRPPSSLDPMGQGLWVAGLALAAVQFLKIRLVRNLVEFKLQGSHLYLGAKFVHTLSTGRKIWCHITVLRAKDANHEDHKHRTIPPDVHDKYVNRIVDAMCKTEVMLADCLPLSDVRIHSRLAIPYLHRVLLLCDVHARMPNLLAGIRKDVLAHWPHAVEKNRWGAQFHVSLDRYDDVHPPHFA